MLILIKVTFKTNPHVDIGWTKDKLKKEFYIYLWI